MKKSYPNKGVWNSIVYIGPREEFFKWAKAIVLQAQKMGEEDYSYGKNLEHSKIYILGTVEGKVIQQVLFVWRHSEACGILETIYEDKITNV